MILIMETPNKVPLILGSPHIVWDSRCPPFKVFMNKEVHKEHLDQLESRLNSVSQSVEKWGDEVPWGCQILTLPYWGLERKKEIDYCIG